MPFSAAIAFRPIERLGGKTGWYYGNWLWRIRGLLDLLFGGAGMRRGRRVPDHLFSGDTIDFWRVEEVQHNHLLRLSAEMRLPGRAWLQFEVEPSGSGSLIRQTAIFDPAGLFGLISDPPIDLRRNAARDRACDGERPLTNFPKPTIVVSKCIGFDPCRYNGGMVQDKFVARLRPHIEVISVRPEVEIGFGIPRAPMRIICSGNEWKLIQPSSGLDG